MILTLSEVSELKKATTEACSANIHFHDGCGGQYFTVDEPSEKLKSFIIDYFAKKNESVRFSTKGDIFSIGEQKSCPLKSGN